MVRHPAATIGYSDCHLFLFLIQAKLWTVTKNGIEPHSWFDFCILPFQMFHQPSHCTKHHQFVWKGWFLHNKVSRPRPPFTGSLDLRGAYRRTFWEFTEQFNSKFETSLPSWLFVRVLIQVQNCILHGKSSGFSYCLLIGRYGWYFISVDILDQLDLLNIKKFSPCRAYRRSISSSNVFGSISVH